MKNLFHPLLILLFSANLLFSADCDGNPISKKFRVSDCDKRDIEVLNEIIELNSLTKTSKTLFGNKKQVSLKPFEVGIQIWSYGRLISINLHNLNLKELPESIGILTTLEKLELSNNQLQSLPNGFGGLKPLKYLYLANNQLSQLPNSIKNLDRLREIDLSNNKLTKLPEKFGNLKSLRLLDLNNNNLKELPYTFKKFRNLNKLDLSNNQLSRLDRQISDLARLKEISARNNNITSIPTNIGNLRNIERINLSGNKIATIPSSIGNCYTLISLNLSENKVNQIPKEIGQLNLLENLDLKKNNISEIPIEFNRLNKIVSLNLAQNQITHLSDKIKNIQSIENIDFSYNRLSKVPNAILNWDNLISINLSHNQITDFNLLNNKFPKLRKLQINNNPIEDFNFSTKNANKITDLNISGTGLSKINESICEFSNAEILLNNNSLCDVQPACVETSINRKLQYCTEPIVEYVDVIKEVFVEKIVEVEAKKKQPNDEFPYFTNPTKQKLFLNSSIEIIKLEAPDTLFALFESPYEYTEVQPSSNNFTYSISNTINQNGQKLNEFSFLEIVGGTDLLNDFKIQLYENLKSYSEDPFEYSQVMAWENEESIEYKIGIGFSWFSLSSWSAGILLKLSDDSRNLSFFLSAVVFKIIQKNLFDKVVTKKILKHPPHFEQFLEHEQLIALAEKYNKQIFEEIKSIN